MIPISWSSVPKPLHQLFFLLATHNNNSVPIIYKKAFELLNDFECGNGMLWKFQMGESFYLHNNDPLVGI